MPPDRIRQMLDLLVSRNALSYQYFLESLILTDNIHIANILEPDYSVSDDCKRMVEREQIPQYPQQVSLQQQQQPLYTSQLVTNSPLYPIICTQHCQNDYSTPAQIQRLRYSNSPLPHYLHQQEINSNYSSQTNSRSSSSQSHSMSPTANRARSSSVTGFYNTRQRNCIGNSSSACFLSSLNKRRSIEEHVIENSPIPVSSDENDQWSPRSSDNRPSVSNIEWNDVNNLEFDFTVFKTVPNIRKELRHEVCLTFFFNMKKFLFIFLKSAIVWKRHLEGFV